jgi:hypothetical protein
MTKNYKKLMLTIAITLAHVASFAQADIWQTSTNWTIYSIEGTKFYKVPVDSLKNYLSRPLNDDSMRRFLAPSTILPPNKAPVWMGAFVATCYIGVKIHKVDISQYGSFLFDEQESKLYQIPAEFEKEWLSYITNAAKAAHTNTR